MLILILKLDVMYDDHMFHKIGLPNFPALAPTSAKLTTQYLVLDHMNNHYRKINKAKREYTWLSLRLVDLYIPSSEALSNISSPIC